MQSIEQLRKALDLIADVAWMGADSNDDSDMVQRISEADGRIRGSFDELAAARERIKKMEDVLQEMNAAFVDDTDDSALAVAARALLVEKVAESGGESGGSEVGE